MMQVPESAEEIFPAAQLIVGDPHESDVAAQYLHSINAEVEFATHLIATSQEALRTQSGVALGIIGARLDEAVLPSARMLRASLTSAEAAFARYMLETTDINGQGAQLRDRVDALLVSIRIQSAEISSIAQSIGFDAHYFWRVGAPIAMPVVSTSAASQTADLVSESMREHLRARWALAARLWIAALVEIEHEHRRWEALIDLRRLIEKHLVLALQRTELGTLAFQPGSPDGVRIALSLPSAKTRALLAPGSFPPPRQHALLIHLIGHTDGRNVWNSPPSPITVSRNWARLSPEQQSILMMQVPWVIGNLPGLPFSVRDQANRNLIKVYDANRGQLDDRSRGALDQIRNLLDFTSEDSVPVSVVSLSLNRGTVPLAAIGYGDLDTADSLTWQVPGMESDADKALNTWDIASRNLFTEQRELADYYDAGEVGVIAFLGYDSPDLNDSFAASIRIISTKKESVFASHLAREGATRLAAELDGTWAARNEPLGVMPGFAAPRSPYIAVAAHSFGTTVAANALMLVRSEIDAFIMIGSAGIDRQSVPSLDALAVVDRYRTGKEIYANSATEDALANHGIRHSGRANPNPNFGIEEVPNYFGAKHFESDGYNDPAGETLKKTDGHSVIGVDERRPDAKQRHFWEFEAALGHGYWDKGTESLRNIAASSLGLHSAITKGN